jgi:3-methyl-2-oxobutanoate hydroxymethyltransferase
MSAHKGSKKISVTRLQALKNAGEKIAMLTCYDYTMAVLLDSSGIEMLLVGDSAANVMAGFETTLPITLDQMIYHAQCVTRGTQRAFVVVDMPFGSYQSDNVTAVHSAVRIMKETGAQAVKLEGGKTQLPIIKSIVNAGIPVMGHLGLTPQRIHQLGNFSTQAKDEESANLLKEEAILLQEAGCFSIVLEKIPAVLAGEVSRNLRIPVIGIGAGNQCDGQVLVLPDMLGLTNGLLPKFVRRYLDMRTSVDQAVHQYITDVKSGVFPDSSESY